MKETERKSVGSETCKSRLQFSCRFGCKNG